MNADNVLEALMNANRLGGLEFIKVKLIFLFLYIILRVLYIILYYILVYYIYTYTLYSRYND